MILTCMSYPIVTRARVTYVASSKCKHISTTDFVTKFQTGVQHIRRAFIKAALTYVSVI